MSQEIKQCPYCGHNARVVLVKLSGLYVVECSHCLNKGFHAQTEERAVILWNERAERKGVKF